ncbi:predicted protein [Pyrenophora tritici-repentis Pt-1C-BFP]|uniref:Uncharacterized protein n=1 Tax=Pyrenophora tritici-repentis (strain Pt-1C-BFP) TaxID=426418 RepID=B2W095_PYRTR|nr:uncharacterized protein PTRG_03085 [Pyrenophora tritici-repentis Pt-1C-BFP]EDU45608.1 predicted protein [Pyrenophora tritici-repentis Pt-1C-BFP]
MSCRICYENSVNYSRGVADGGCPASGLYGIGGTILRLKPGITSGASYSHKRARDAFVGMTAGVEHYSMAAHTI